MPTLTRFLGRNGGRAPTEIGDLECVTLQNLFLSGHSLKLRGGISNVNTSFGADPIWGLHRSYIVDGTPFWMVTTGTKLKSNRGGAFADLFTFASGNKGVGFAEARGSTTNNIYVFPANTTDIPRKSDGTVGGTIAHPDADIPKCSFGVWHQRRLFVNDLNDFDKLWFSDTNDADVFRNQDTSAVATEGGWIRFSSGDGDRVRGFQRLGSVLFVIKERSVHMLLGSSFVGDEIFRVVELFRGIGSKSPRTIVPVENGLMFLDSDGLLRYFYGPSRTLLSGIGRPIEDLTTAIPATRLEDAAAVYFDRKYCLSFAAAGATTNTLVWAVDMRLLTPLLNTESEADLPSAWSEMTGSLLGWNVAVNTNGQGDTAGLYYGDRSAGLIRQFLTGLTDDGAAIAYAYKTKAYGADAPTQIKSVSEITTATRTGTAVVTHEMYANLAAAATASKALTPSSAAFSVNTWRPGETARGALVQAGLSGSSSLGLECLSLDWDWSPKRKDVVDA